MIRTLLTNFIGESLVMKAIHLWGWLCIALMVAALLNPLYLMLVG